MLAPPRTAFVSAEKARDHKGRKVMKQAGEASLDGPMTRGLQWRQFAACGTPFINSPVAMAGKAGRNLRILGLSQSVYMLFTKLIRMSHVIGNFFNQLAEIA
jgi:hypothetical protein